MSVGRSEICGVCINRRGGSFEEKERNRRVGHWLLIAIDIDSRPTSYLRSTRVPSEQLSVARPQKSGSSLFQSTIFARQAGLGFRPEARKKGAQGTVTTAMI